MDSSQNKREQLIVKLVELLKETPEGSRPSEICASALNRISEPYSLICRIQVLPASENKTIYGI